MKSPKFQSHRFASLATLLPLSVLLPLPLRANNNPDIQGNQAIVASSPEPGNLTVAGKVDVGGAFKVIGDIDSQGSIAAWGTLDFGQSVANATLAGTTLSYVGGTSKFSISDITDASGTFRWRDNAGGTAREKMRLDSANVLSLYDAAGSTASITLNGGNGQINLTGTGSGIYSGGSAVFSLGSGGAISYGSTRQISILNTTAASTWPSTTAAMTVAGGILSSKDSIFNGTKVGRGGGNQITNVAVGPNALDSNTTGSSNTALGYNALYYNLTGYDNIALGFQPLMYNSIGSGNFAAGTFSLYANTGGSNNLAIGTFSLYQNASGNHNIALGADSLHSNYTGGYNIGTGRKALYLNSSGSYNIASGDEALGSNRTGWMNIAFGSSALYRNDDGEYNIALGNGALYENTSGFANIAIGTAALESAAGATWNVAIGEYAATPGEGSDVAHFSPNNSIYIGNYTRTFDETDDNAIVIGYGAQGEGSNTTVIGNQDTETTHLYGQTKANSLKVAGATVLDGQVTITVPQGNISMGIYGD